jgi:hypothetical protein
VRIPVSGGNHCDFTHPFATNGSIHLPQVQRKALYFDSAKNSPKRKWKHPFAKSAIWKQQLAESTGSELETAQFKGDLTLKFSL